MGAPALRYRDPALLNSSTFDAFPPELRESLDGLRPATVTEWLRVRRRRSGAPADAHGTEPEGVVPAAE